MYVSAGRFGKRLLTSDNELLRPSSIIGDQHTNRFVGVDDLDQLIVHPDRLHQVDRVRIDSLRLLGVVDDCMGNRKVQPKQISNLLEERDGLGIEIDGKLQGRLSVRLDRRVALSDDFEQPPSDSLFASCDILDPCFKDRRGVELLAEKVAFRLEPLSLGIHLPALSEHVFDTLHVGRELLLDLFGPDDSACDWREIAELRHVRRFGIAVVAGELQVEFLDVLLDRVDEARLVLLDRPTDLNPTGERSAALPVGSQGGQRFPYLGSHKQRIEFGEDPEHLVSVAGSSQTVSQARDDLVLNPSHTFVIGTLGSDPDLRAL